MSDNTENFEASTDDGPVEEVETAEEEKPAAKAEDPQEEEEQEVTADDSGEKRPSNRVQKRIDKLTKSYREEQRRNDELQERLAKLEAQASKGAEEPDPSDFDDWDTYQAALNDFRSKQSQQATQQVNPIQRELTRAIANMEDSIEEAREKYEDYDDVTTAEDLHITEYMVMAMSEEEDAAEIAYYLGKHKKEAARIATLSPMRQATEIGKLAGKRVKQPAKKQTKAPDPIEPVTASGDPAKKKPDEMSFAEYEQFKREKQGKKSFW